MPITEARIQEILKSTVDPTTGKDYVSAKSVKSVEVSGDAVTVDLVLGYPARSVVDAVSRQIGDAQHLAELTGIGVVADFRSADVAAGGRPQRGIDPDRSLRQRRDARPARVRQDADVGFEHQPQLPLELVDSLAAGDGE